MPEGFQWVLQVFHFETSSESTHHHHHYGIEKLIGWIYKHRHNGCHIRSCDRNLPELWISCILLASLFQIQFQYWCRVRSCDKVLWSWKVSHKQYWVSDLLHHLLTCSCWCCTVYFLVLVLFLGVKYDYERIAPWKRCDIVKLCLSPDINIPFLCIFPIGVGTCPPGFLETEKWKHLLKLSLGGLLVKMRRWWEMAEEIDRSGGNCFLSFSL